MCDFHSIIVRRDGAIGHVAKNSHSGAVEAAGWRENDQMADLREPFFVEAEWNCEGPFPGASKITRGTPNAKQLQVVKDHYTALVELLEDPAKHGEKYCTGSGRFASDEWADVRWKVLSHPKCPKRLANKLAVTQLFADGNPVKSLHPLIKAIEGQLAIEEKCEITAPVLAQSGDIVLYAGATLTAPVLAQSGDIVLRDCATLTAPVLAQSGDIVLRDGATLTAPVLARSGKIDL